MGEITKDRVVRTLRLKQGATVCPLPAQGSCYLNPETKRAVRGMRPAHSHLLALTAGRELREQIP